MHKIIRSLGMGVLGYMAPRILKAVGIPIDIWAQSIGQKIAGVSTEISPDIALSVFGLLLAVILITTELWFSPVGWLIQYVRRQSFHVELDKRKVTLNGYERVCAITIKNLEPKDLKNRCLVQIENITGHIPEHMQMPFVLRTEGQIRGNRSGRFNLSSKQPKTIPILFRKQKRKNEWFFFDEHGQSYFVSPKSFRLDVGVYGGRFNRLVQIGIEVLDNLEVKLSIK